MATAVTQYAEFAGNIRVYTGAEIIVWQIYQSGLQMSARIREGEPMVPLKPLLSIRELMVSI